MNMSYFILWQRKNPRRAMRQWAAIEIACYEDLSVRLPEESDDEVVELFVQLRFVSGSELVPDDGDGGWQVLDVGSDCDGVLSLVAVNRLRVGACR